MKKIIVSLLLCSAVWAQQTAPVFDQSLYDRHKSNATAYLVGAVTLATISFASFMGSQNWAKLESGTEDAINRLLQVDPGNDEFFDASLNALKHERDVQSGNKGRFLVACGVSGGLAILSAAIAGTHFYAAKDMVQAKVSISPGKAELGLAIRF